jgi:CRISPR/Cas system-associated endonuclease/helicase Cas3
MTLDEIFTEWETDSKIDRTEIGEELRRLPMLHGKYWRFFSEERLRLRMLEGDMKVLKLAKGTFYQDGPDEVSREKGWEYPPRGRLLRGDVPQYVDADQDILKMQTRIDIQKEKVDLLDSIIRHIKDRGFHLGHLKDWIKFENGGS